MSESIELELRHFIEENFLVGQQQSIGNNDSFLEAGIIDSTGILELMTYLEERYGIELDSDDLTPENLDSVSRLVQFVSRKIGRLSKGVAACNENETGTTNENGTATTKSPCEVATFAPDKPQ